MIRFKLIHPSMTHAALGWLPSFLDERDPRPVREQIAENYAHGGGWRPRPGFILREDSLVWPASADGDEEVMPLLAEARLRDEFVRLYTHDWLVVLQRDGTYEVSRVD